MNADPPWTIGSLLQWTTDYFKKHQAASPRLDAEVLLADSRGCQRIELYTAFDEEATDELRQRFRELVRRRAAGEPVAYLVGKREFYSLPFHITRDVLIPRPETELLVMSALDLAKAQPDRTRPWRILDVGTGSGVIAVSVARHLPQCEVVAVDVSPAALEVAQRNARNLHVDDRVQFLVSDLLSALPPEARFDIIVSNPPYVSEEEMRDLDDEVKNFEPHQALLAGPTGVEVIDRLIPQAANALVGGGHLLVEISPMIADSVLQRFAQNASFTAAHVVKDLAGLARVVAARRVESTP